MTIDTKYTGKKYPVNIYEVGKEKIKEYAKAIKNPDPHYVDDDFAKKSKYGSIIAPPTYAVLFGYHIIEEIFTDKELNLNMAMLVHGEQEYDFYEVIKAGDIITTDSEITNIENKEKLDLISIELKSRNQENVDVCRGIYTFVIRK